MSLNTRAKADALADEIITDLCDRNGLSDEFCMLDDDTQTEIREQWSIIIQTGLTEAFQTGMDVALRREADDGWCGEVGEP